MTAAGKDELTTAVLERAARSAMRHAWFGYARGKYYAAVQPSVAGGYCLDVPRQEAEAETPKEVRALLFKAVMEAIKNREMEP